MKQLPKPFQNLVFLDIETVPATADFKYLDEPTQQFWSRKASFIARESSPEDAYERAGIYAEFGKVIVIGVGYFVLKDGELSLRVKTLKGDDEKALLEEFKQLIEQRFAPEKLRFVAHNGKEFDYPYLARRMMVNHIPLPEVLKLTAAKPWGHPHLDTMEMWRFGDRKGFTSLKLMAHILGVEGLYSQGMDGSDVYAQYYEKKDLDSIAKYCAEDIVATAQVFLRLSEWPLLSEENIVRVDG